MEKDYEVLESAVRQTFAGVVWSHKIQEKQADIFAKRFKRMELVKIAASSLTSVGIVSLLIIDEWLIKIASALVSFVSVFVSGFFKSFDLQTMVGQHKSAANNLLAVRDNISLLLLQIKLKKETTNVLFEKYETIMAGLAKVYADAPNTTDEAVDLARKALNVNMDNTFSDQEIDGFLPIGLRKEQ